jgi:UDP-N-acetylglucosamine acyltransferase
MIGGASAVAKDIPPYVLAAGNQIEICGLNLIGLRRRGFTKESIRALKKAYIMLFRSERLFSVSLEMVEKECNNTPEVRHLLEFIKKSERGICR